MVIVTICRTIFYQILLLFVGLSVGFIINAEYVGAKSMMLHRSINNIFFPVEFDEHMERWVKGWGSYRVYMQKNCPDGFEVIDEYVYANEEYYWCRFKYKDKGKVKFDEDVTRVRWKTWEYYYEPDSVLDTDEKVKEEFRKDREDLEKRRKERERARERERRILAGDEGS